MNRALRCGSYVPAVSAILCFLPPARVPIARRVRPLGKAPPVRGDQAATLLSSPARYAASSRWPTRVGHHVEKQHGPHRDHVTCRSESKPPQRRMVVHLPLVVPPLLAPALPAYRGAWRDLGADLVALHLQSATIPRPCPPRSAAKADLRRDVQGAQGEI